MPSGAVASFFWLGKTCAPIFCTVFIVVVKFRGVLIGMRLMFWVLNLAGLDAAIMDGRGAYISMSQYIWSTLQSELASFNLSVRLLIKLVKNVLHMNGTIPDSSYLDM